MNVQFYVQRAEDAIAALALGLRLGSSVSREANARLIPFEQHMRFHREMRAGTAYTVRAAPISVVNQIITITAEMRTTIGDEVSFALTGRYAWSDQTSHAALDLPQASLDRALTMVQPLPPSATPRGLTLTRPASDPSRERADELGLAMVLKTQVQADQCDAQGYMRTRDYIGRISDGIPNLITQSARIEDRQKNPRIGGAALEYRLLYRKAARQGDLISVRSAITSLGTKTYNWVHWIVNEETGEALATAEAVAISMDLEARKALVISDDLRRTYETMLKPNLRP